MKLSRSLAAFVAASVFAVGVVFAAETAAPKAKPEGNPGKCCVEANAADKNCEKCGGTNPEKKS